MVAVHGNTAKITVHSVNLKSPKGTVTMMLFIYSTVYKYFYEIVFLDAYFTFHQPREVKTNSCMENKGIFKKVASKNIYQLLWWFYKTFPCFSSIK